jgi:hypothetical protein
MRRGWVCAVLVVPFFVVSVVSLLAQGAQQPPQVRVETLYPKHAAPGRATVINVAIPSPDTVDAAEISPPAGVTVAGVKGIGSGSEQNIGWWEVTLDVAKDAAPGNRSLVLAMRRGGRTAPVMIAIPTHGPTIADLKVVRTQSNQELQMAAMDAAGDLGDEPYVWFAADCGSEPIVGALRGKASPGALRVTLPNLRHADGSAVTGRCDLQVRITDGPGVDSNTLKTTIEFRN